MRRMVNSDLRQELDPFLDAFSRYRREHGGRIGDPTVYPGLPESGLRFDRGTWQLRVLDLQLIARTIGDRAGLEILDVGAWNGWLSHRLAARGNALTAVDVFTDPFDGLGAVRHYPVKFRAIQCDQERLDRLDGPYDLIVAQRCMGYMVDIRRSIDQLRSLLAPQGSIVFTGLNIFRDPSRIREHFRRSAERFQQRYDRPFFFKPVKGYLDANDEATLRSCGVSLHPYPALWHKNLLARWMPRRPLYLYGTIG